MREWYLHSDAGNEPRPLKLPQKKKVAQKYILGGAHEIVHKHTCVFDLFLTYFVGIPQNVFLTYFWATLIFGGL